MDVDVDLWRISMDFPWKCWGNMGKPFQNGLKIRFGMVWDSFFPFGEERWLVLTEVWGFRLDPDISTDMQLGWTFGKNGISMWETQ